MTKKELEKAQDDVHNFCEQFTSVFTLTNAKGTWMGRMTRKSVQVFIVTGESMFECIVKASEKATEKRKTLGV